MIAKFITREEFERFCETSMFCLCGQLMTGLHMQNCRRIRTSGKKFYADASEMERFLR